MKVLCIFLMFIPIHAWAYSLCEKGEVTYFSCVNGEKIISICVSKKTSVTQYRSGNKHNIKFKYPMSNTNQKGIFFYSRMDGSGWGEQHLRFNDKKYTYLIYDGWYHKLPPKIGEDYKRGVSIFKKKAIPKNGEKAEFNRKYLISEMECKKASGLMIKQPWGEGSGPWPELEDEGFIYGP